MKKIIISSTLVLSIIAIVALTVFACEKEESKVINTKSLGGGIIPELTDAQVAHLTEIDSLIRSILNDSKSAQLRDPIQFEKVCKSGDYIAFSNLLGYSEAKCIELSNQLRLLGELTWGDEFAPSDNSYCQQCSLAEFPATLADIPMTKQKEGDPMAAAMCFNDCMIACLGFSFNPAMYFACVATCTGLCYYLSTAVKSAH